MKVSIQIQKKYDRIVYKTKNGINYHQGTERIDLSFADQDDELTKIYFDLKRRGKKNPIKKAIKLFELKTL